MTKSETVPGLRAQQKAATRNELIRMGVALFLKQGFVNTTIDQIVAPLGIAKRTFFRYFKTKEDLLFGWQIEKTTDLVRELKARPRQEKPYKAVCETLASLLEYYDTSPDRALAFMNLTKETPSLIGRNCEKRMIWEQALVAALIEREGKGAMRPLEARIIVGTAMVAWLAALAEWYEEGGKPNLHPIVKKAFSMAGEV